MRTILLFLSLAFVLSSSVLAQEVDLLEWYNLPGGPYYTSPFDYCDQDPNPAPVDFIFTYQYCPDDNPNCIETCGSNSFGFLFKATARLLRDGQFVAQQNFEMNLPEFEANFYDPVEQSGNYQVEVILYRKRNGCIFGYVPVAITLSNIIVVNSVANTTSFNINNQSINNSPLTVCESNIIINAANSSCEENYYIAVEESDQYWNRTFEYEWGAWLTGQAPNGIDLQGISQFIPSIDPSTYTGTDASRRGERLKGGTLSSGGDRYYRVKVCTSPTWTCKYALIKVNPNCRVDPNAIITDNNTYVLLDENESTAKNGATEAEGKPNQMDLIQEQTALITIAPNPFQQTATIQIEGYSGKAPVVFELYNTLGERVVTQQSNQTTFDIERGNLAAGIYVYRATAGEKVLGSGKISIQ